MTVIAIDYDGTYATNKVFWHDFVHRAIASGYPVVCVTGRTEQQRIDEDLLMMVVYAGDRYKADALRDRLGVDGDVIWIDNEPGHIEPPKKLDWSGA